MEATEFTNTQLYIGFERATDYLLLDKRALKAAENLRK